MKRLRRSKAFTFLEIMLVVAIIGMLFGIVGINIVGKTKKAKMSATMSQMQNVATALQEYEINVGALPSTAQALDALLECPSDVEEEDWGDTPYLQARSVPKDSWGEEFIYRSPAEEGNLPFDLISKGPDREEGTEDDIDFFGEKEEM